MDASAACEPCPVAEPTPVALRWEAQPDGAVFGFAGLLAVAVVSERTGPCGRPGWAWEIVAIRGPWLRHGRGRKGRLSAARRAADRAWGRWLARAHLVPAVSP